MSTTRDHGIAIDDVELVRPAARALGADGSLPIANAISDYLQSDIRAADAAELHAAVQAMAERAALAPPPRGRNAS